MEAMATTATAPADTSINTSETLEDDEDEMEEEEEEEEEEIEEVEEIEEIEEMEEEVDSDEEDVDARPTTTTGGAAAAASTVVVGGGGGGSGKHLSDGPSQVESRGPEAAEGGTGAGAGGGSADGADDSAGGASATASSSSSSSSSASSSSSSSSAAAAVEGTNIHFSAEGKKLCSYSGKLCKQRRMEGRAFCIKHILEDPTSGFRQCEYLCKKKGNRRCTNPVPPPHDDEVYCSHHRQILGLQPRTVVRRGQAKSKTKSELRSKEAHTALVNVLAKHGIHEKSGKRQTKKPTKTEEPPTPAEEEVSSDEFPSDEENGEEADVESGAEDVISDQDRDHDNDGFIADSFLWHLEHDNPNLLEDAEKPLDGQQAMTEEEVINMRRAKVTRLLQLYKLQYYRLQDYLQSTHELYSKRLAVEKSKRNGSSDGKQQKGEKRPSAKEKKDKQQEDQLRSLYVHSRAPMIKLEPRGFCSVEECKARALEPSSFCFNHILRDPKQQLYVGCTHASGKGQTCSFPVLRTRQPPLCDTHMDAQAKKEATSKKKRKASHLLEEREKERAREQQEKKQKQKRKRKSRSSSESGFMQITSENAARFSVAAVLQKVDYNVETIQQKRGKLLEEENRRRLEAMSSQAEGGEENEGAQQSDSTRVS